MIIETIKRILNMSFMNRVHRDIVNTYWDAAENIDEKQRLVSVFGSVVENREVDKALRLAWDLWHKTDFIDNIYTHVSSTAQKEDILELARYFAKSPVSETLISCAPVWYRDAVVKIAERCPLEERAQLLSIMDSTPNLTEVMKLPAGEHAVKFYSQVTKGMTDAEVIARLKASPSWNAIDHRNRIFVEWISEKDTRLFAALN